MDPLTVLKEYAAGRRNKKEVSKDGKNYVIFDDVAYPKDAMTSLLQYGKTNSYYTLEALLLLWENRALQHALYVKNASGGGIMAVTRADRKEILEYLEGRRAAMPSSHDHIAAIPSTIPLSHFHDLEGPERKKAKLDPAIAKAPRIDHLLNDGPSLSASADSGEIRDLNDQLTADKIAALRAKRKNNQRKTITNTLEENDISGGDSMMQVDRTDSREKERVWRTRENCLEAATRSFANVITLLQGIKTREEAQQRTKMAANGQSHAPVHVPGSAGGPRSATEAARQAAAARSRTAGYSRYDQEQFNTEDADEFGAGNTETTFVGKSNLFMQPSSTPKTPASRPQTSQPTPSSARSMTSHSSTPSAPMKTLQSATPDRPHKRTSRTPIIIIPAATSSIISMLNVKDILQEMRFTTTEEKKASGARRENECLLQRRKNEGTIPYRVVDNALKLSSEEWDRVVAVFAMGPAWQFKGWKWGGNPVDIFANVAAFHLTFDDMKVDANIAKWSVTVIPVNRTKRHLDKARLVKFWDVLDRHMLKTKPHLRH